MTDAYQEFLARKAIHDPMTGLANVPDLPAAMFPHQRDITAWALRRGRAAVFAGTGLGKSFMELAWAEAIAAHTGKPILHLAPLAVSNQLVREAEKFGIAAQIATRQDDCGPGINVTNYQKLDHFEIGRFGGVILDESSILKNDQGHYRNMLIDACHTIPFRLAATATPAPNDFVELGNHAEFLGVMKKTDMQATFFKHDGGSTQNWYLKGHAENDFWAWMASWAVMLRKPSDLGYPNDGYDLPPLNYHQHTVKCKDGPNYETGALFAVHAETLAERIAARRDTVEDRCRMAVSVVIGSFRDKLATWFGNQNTLTRDGQNTSLTKQSANAANHKADHPKKTANTCANITSKIGENIGAPQSSKPKSIGGAESDTQAMLLSEKSANGPLDHDARTQSAAGGSNPLTEWTQPNTRRCLIGRADAAQSVEPSQGTVSTSITAIEAAASGDFSALRAIPASDISRMTQIGLIEPWCIWCNLNSEQDELAKAFGPLAFSISGSTPDELKEAQIGAWLSGERPVMISKPSIIGFGMNFQHCNQTAFVGLNDSFEQFYQAVRRFWRFGQTNPVDVHLIASEREGATVANIKRKEADADRMAAAMVMHMADLSSQAVRGSERDTAIYNPQIPVQLPSFLEAA